MVLWNLTKTPTVTQQQPLITTDNEFGSVKVAQLIELGII